MIHPPDALPVWPMHMAKKMYSLWLACTTHRKLMPTKQWQTKVTLVNTTRNESCWQGHTSGHPAMLQLSSHAWTAVHPSSIVGGHPWLPLAPKLLGVRSNKAMPLLVSMHSIHPWGLDKSLVLTVIMQLLVLHRMRIRH